LWKENSQRLEKYRLIGLLLMRSSLVRLRVEFRRKRWEGYSKRGKEERRRVSVKKKW